MKQASFAAMQCSIARSLDLVGSWWSLLIIRDAFMGVRRFKDFERSLGIARNTLTDRLDGLVQAGILAKVPAADGSKYRDYELTEKGLDLTPVLMALAQWGDKWAAHAEGPTFAFQDGKTGAAIDRVWPRRADGQPLGLEEIEIVPWQR